MKRRRTAADAALPATAVPGDSTSAVPSIASLPLDLLCEIFAFAPYRASVLAIGLVCKRFRIAALRSIRHIAVNSGTRPLPDLALLPQVRSLDARPGILASTLLPTALQRLALSHLTLQDAFYRYSLGQPTFISAHFPQLTALRIHIDEADDRATDLIVAFLTRHGTQLTALDFSSEAQGLTIGVATLAFPVLKKLRLKNLAAAMVLPFAVVAPSAALHLSCIAPHFTSLLALRSRLVAVDLHGKSEAALEALGGLPHLRAWSCSPPVVLRGSPLNATLTDVTVQTKAVLDELLTLTNLKRLFLEHVGSGHTFPWALPRLRELSIGTSSKWFADELALPMAMDAVRALPRLKTVRLFLESTYLDEERYTTLVECAARRGVQLVEIFHFGELSFARPACEAGWLTVRLHYQSF